MGCILGGRLLTVSRRGCAGPTPLFPQPTVACARDCVPSQISAGPIARYLALARRLTPHSLALSKNATITDGINIMILSMMDGPLLVSFALSAGPTSLSPQPTVACARDCVPSAQDRLLDTWPWRDASRHILWLYPKMQRSRTGSI
ncbi:hypothetical protein niasHS_011818 [Heterodera schachtii]|uniref:Uncharacterized protein n=1 Tax=Heterodera schachtii TaxID=97005 RepID=A0ABD2IQD9_HETSC